MKSCDFGYDLSFLVSIFELLLIDDQIIPAQKLGLTVSPMHYGKKNLLDKYQEYLWQDYVAYCKRQQIDEDFQGFITYIIDKGHISDLHIKRFTVLREFDPLRQEQQTRHKTHAVEVLADRFNLSERTIWNILKHKKWINSSNSGKSEQ